MKYLASEWERVKQFVLLMFRERRLDAVEALLAMQAVIFGFWLVLPWSTFGIVAAIYDTMAFVPEWFWGCAFMVHGLLHLRAVDRRNVYQRRGLTSVLVFLWLTMLVGFLVSAPQAPATPMFFLPVMGGLWCYHSHTLILADQARRKLASE